VRLQKAEALQTTTFESKGMRKPNKLSNLKWRVEPECKGISLAEHLVDQLLISPAQASALIDFGSVQIDGRQQRNAQKKLDGDEEIQVHWPRHGVRRFYEADPERILFRDRFLLAYAKEAGIPSQQIPADAYNNLFAALQRFLERLLPEAYVALHHRLDRETSGVMLFAIDRSVNRKLGAAFQNRQVIKDYLAWVEGSPERDEWVAAEDIGRQSGRYVIVPKGHGKSAETAFRVLLREKDRSLLWARPKTGRAHQIRLHAAASGHAVIGDRLYGAIPAARLYLHAYRMSLTHPASAAQLVLTAPIPSDWPAPHSVTLPMQM